LNPKQNQIEEEKRNGSNSNLQCIFMNKIPSVLFISRNIALQIELHHTEAQPAVRTGLNTGNTREFTAR